MSQKNNENEGNFPFKIYSKEISWETCDENPVKEKSKDMESEWHYSQMKTKIVYIPSNYVSLINLVSDKTSCFIIVWKIYCVINEVINKTGIQSQVVFTING